MGLIAIELNDAAIAAVDDSGLLFVEPGYAVVASGGPRFGAEALPALRLNPRAASTRYWREFGEQPLAPPLAGFPTPADLVHAHLASLWQRCGTGFEGVLFAVPACWSTDQLGLLLGIAADLHIPVVGLVDAAIAATRSEYPRRQLFHLEASLHGIALSHIDQAGHATLAGREQLDFLGIESLERVAAELIARRFVECSRFDPLQGARTEQQLFERLPEWLARIGRQPETRLEFAAAAGRFEATVAAAALFSRMGEVFEPLLRRLRALGGATGPLTLQVHSRLAEFPGALESLLRLTGAAVHVLEPGAAARGALRRAAAVRTDAGGLRLVTALAWDAPAIETEPVSPGSVAAARRPTHVLAGHRAYRLGAAPFHIGAGLGEGEYGIALDPGVQGVSRRHCTLQSENGRLLAFDHSRFGTLLNGHRIDGAAVLETGDVLAVGSPAVEFRLLDEVDERGP